MYKFVVLFAVVAVTACSAKESAPATTDSTTVVMDTTAVVPADTATSVIVK